MGNIYLVDNITINMLSAEQFKLNFTKIDKFIVKSILENNNFQTCFEHLYNLTRLEDDLGLIIYLDCPINFEKDDVLIYAQCEETQIVYYIISKSEGDEI